jgi:predicted DNA-binding transcriptional regulator AlpA
MSQLVQRRAKRAVLPLDQLPDGMLPLTTVLDFVPVSRTTFLRYVKGGTYPQPVPLTARKLLWRANDIRALMTAGPRKPRAVTTS